MPKRRTVPQITLAELATGLSLGVPMASADRFDLLLGSAGFALLFNRVRRTPEFRRWTANRIYELEKVAPDPVLSFLERLPQPHLEPIALLEEPKSVRKPTPRQGEVVEKMTTAQRDRAELLGKVLGPQVLAVLREGDEFRDDTRAEEQPRQLPPGPSQGKPTPVVGSKTQRLDEDEIVLGPRVEPQQERQPAAPSFEVLSLLEGLERLLTEEAVLVLGPKGSGKTTLGLALYHAANAKRKRIAIIDPHATKNPWPKDGVPIFGIGMNYEEADAAIAQLFAEMRERYGRTLDEEHVYCFIDEVPSLQEECESWSKFISKLLREARKVNIHLVVLSQSYLVEDLGLNSNTRKNLAVVALGNARPVYAQREMLQLDKAEKDALVRQVRDQKHHAILDLGATPVVIDLNGAMKVTSKVEPLPWNLLKGRYQAPVSSSRPAQAVVAAREVVPATEEELFLAAMFEKYGARAGVSSVSGGTPAGTPTGTSGVPQVPGTTVPASSNASSDEFQGTSQEALKLLHGASPEERRNLGTSWKLLTVVGRQQAIMTGFKLTSKGRSYSRAAALLAALETAQAAGLVKE